MILAMMILACQGASGLNPFATTTPTPTVTFTPSITPSPTPSSTPTYAATATSLPGGRVKEEQSDGTTLFTDYNARCQVTFPKNWTLLILGEDDINALPENVLAQQQNVSEMIETLKKTDVNKIIRVVGYNFKAQQGRYIPNINISYDTNAIYAALSLKDLVDAMVAYYPSLNIKVINSEMKQTSSGIEIGAIEAQWSMKASGSQTVNLEQKQIFFKSGEGVVVLTFSTVKGAAMDLSADFQDLIESVQLLEK